MGDGLLVGVEIVLLRCLGDDRRGYRHRDARTMTMAEHRLSILDESDGTHGRTRRGATTRSQDLQSEGRSQDETRQADMFFCILLARRKDRLSFENVFAYLDEYPGLLFDCDQVGLCRSLNQQPM